MPYFIFKVKPAPAPVHKLVEQLESHPKFKDAKAAVHNYRVENTTEIDIEFKIVFAENGLDAEEKLMEVREKPIMMEWEK